ncbi:neutral zinc metallopeptidase [Nocardioides sp. TF02-7]|uniref:KPN_02809 family neutral zinc metallopeptidase n=1 Tax=Nocardioides sp. TF02-7 TaxID=2917724 RepID=UPI001F06B976|nr:neutral zinc metallopeptidase [Nocardioides sp. TF02-7]UMG92431.1 neutral zinc metallopeptidase [Nocardioides sp. TF02-7]
MVRFNPRARLDRSRVRDTGSRGGGYGGRGMRLPIPGGAGAKGGLGGIVLVIAFVVLAQVTGINPFAGAAYDPSRLADADDTGRYDHCETGEDANADHDCARVAVENSLTDFWEGALGGDFRPIESLTTFGGSVGTQCGGADSSVGPFYCPADESVYLDTTFFDQVLERQLGGPDGGFVEFYVLAHEYGHHISNLLGFMGQVRTQETGPTSPGVRLELQADCYAGLWTQHATTTEDAAGEVLLVDLSERDIDLAIKAAEAVGDDSIQRKTQGQVTEESWTHGSAAQRKHWFLVGYEQGDVQACDTFAASEAEVLGR